MREPCLIPCLGLMAGLVLNRWLPSTPGWPEAALGLVAAAGVWFTGSRLRRLLIFCAACALGLWLPFFYRPRKAPPLPIDGLAQVRACVVEPAVFFEGRTRFTVELEPGVLAHVSHYPAAGSGPALEAGQAIEMHARFRRPDRYRNPGSFDYPEYLARRHVWFLATAPANRPITVTGTCGSSFVRTVSGIRQFLLRRIQGLHADEPDVSGLMEALLLGESKRVRKEWTDDFRKTGTYHAIVVSGQHVVVLTGCVALAGRLFLPPTAALALSVAIAWIYALLAGFSAPVVRSAAGISVFLFAAFFHRRGRLLNILAVVAMGLLLLDPGQLFDPSFQLSFLAVAAIGGLAEPVIERFIDPWRTAARAPTSPEPAADPRVEAIRIEWRLLAKTGLVWLRIPPAWTLATLAWSTRLGSAMAESLTLSALVQAAIALPGVLYFHRFSFTGLTANIAFGPLLGAAIPLGFLNSLVSSAWLAAVNSWLVNASLAVARWHVGWEPEWRVPDPPWWLALALTAAAMTAAVSLRVRLWRPAAMAVWLILSGLLLWHPFAPQVGPDTLELTAVDVGQGDGLLLALPDGSLAAIDAGGFPGMGNDPGQARKPDLDLGEDVLAPYFWTRSIRRLDVIVLTHAHADHVGGAMALLRNFTPREIWTGLMPPNEPAWAEIEALARQRGIRIRQPRAGDHWSFGGARFAAWAPFREDQPADRAHNNDSLVFTVSHGRHRFLLTGDAEALMEHRMLDSGLSGPFEVLKVGHHGSRTSTSEEFLNEVQPAVAVISCGRQNGFRHPNSRVIGRLMDHRSVILRTDVHGLVTIRSDGRHLDTRPFHSF